MLNKRRRKTKSMRRKIEGARKRDTKRRERLAWEALNQAEAEGRYAALLEQAHLRLNSWLSHNGYRAPFKQIASKRASLVQCTRRIPKRDSYLLLNIETNEVLFTASSRAAIERAVPFYQAQNLIPLIRRVI